MTYISSFDSYEPCNICEDEPGKHPNKKCKRCQKVFCTKHFIPKHFMGREDFIWFLHEKTCIKCCDEIYDAKRSMQPSQGPFTPCACCDSKERRPKFIMECDHCHKKCCDRCIKRFQVKREMRNDEPAYEVCVKCQAEHGYFSRIGLDHEYSDGTRCFLSPTETEESNKKRGQATLGDM